MGGVQVGEVTHFYANISVAVIELSGSIHLGDSVHFLGRMTDFRQEVKSLQIEHQSVEEAGAGQEVSMQVVRRVRRRDKVYKLSGDG